MRTLLRGKRKGLAALDYILIISISLAMVATLVVLIGPFLRVDFNKVVREATRTAYNNLPLGSPTRESIANKELPYRTDGSMTITVTIRGVGREICTEGPAGFVDILSNYQEVARALAVPGYMLPSNLVLKIDGTVLEVENNKFFVGGAAFVVYYYYGEDLRTYNTAGFEMLLQQIGIS